MDATSPRWQAVTDSAFPWERDALAFVRDRLPDHEPYRAWANFEFIADDGSINEVDTVAPEKSSSSAPPFPYGHDIGRLLDRAEQVPADMRQGVALTLYYYAGRYPDIGHEHESTTRAEYEQAMANAAGGGGWTVRRVASLLPAAAPDPA